MIWQPFTDRAKAAVYAATEETARLGEHYVGTEHLLLGRFCIGNNTALRVLSQLGVSPSDLRPDIERYVTRVRDRSGAETQFTTRARNVLELASEETRLLQHDTLGTGHILLGLIREQDGLAARALGKGGVKLEAARRIVSELQDDEKQPPIGDDLQQLSAALSERRRESTGRLTGVLLLADRGGEPWWQVSAAASRSDELLEEIRALGFPDAAAASDQWIWVRPARQDERE